MERIGIVICNYNKEKDVLDCIQSVLDNTYKDYFIYVVDNASADSSVELIQERFAPVENLMLIVNEENLGGSGGFNTGLRAAYERGHELFMCIDNDAMLDENCIEELVRHMDADPETGIAAAKIYHRGMEDYVQQYGSFIDWNNYSVNSIYLNRVEDGSMPEVVYSDAVPACALMIRREVVDKIGFLPEENFLYWDDTEWCVRCTMAGYQVASVGKAQAVHAMGAKKEDVNTFPTYYAWRNWIKFFVDHMPNARLEDMTRVFLNSIFEITYSGYFRKEPNRTKTVMAAYDDALHGITGKAGEERIFQLEKSYDGMGRIAEGRTELVIITGEFPLFAESLAEKLGTRFPEKTVIVKEKNEEGLKNTRDRAVISLCESIFRQEDLSLSVYVTDLDENVIADENDALYVINFPFARDAFVFAHQPEFLRLAKELRR